MDLNSSPNHKQPKVSTMKLTPYLTALILGSALLLSSAWLSPALAKDKPTDPSSQRGWLSIGQVHQRLEAAGYRDVEKIERERGGYEARATNRQGERTKLTVNPQTGDITDRRASDPRANNAQNSPRRNALECNKRRCRDDLQPNPVNPPSSASPPAAAKSSR